MLKLAKKGIKKIMNRLSNNQYSFPSKGSLRDEFVTSGESDPFATLRIILFAVRRSASGTSQVLFRKNKP